MGYTCSSHRYLVLFRKPSLSVSNQVICVHRLRSLPEKPAAIDWSYYKSAVANTAMVDQFEKQVTDCKLHI